MPSSAENKPWRVLRTRRQASASLIQCRNNRWNGEIMGRIDAFDALRNEIAETLAVLVQPWAALNK